MRISINLFTLALFTTIFLVQALFFSAMFERFESQYKRIIVHNIQSKAIVLKHYLLKNLRPDNIDSIVSSLDNLVNTSDLIKDIRIVDEHNRLLYVTSRAVSVKESQTVCTPLLTITQQDIEKSDCFYFPIRIYNRFKPIHYTVYIYLEKKPIHDFLQKEERTFYAFFLLFSIFATLLFWLLLRNFVLKPLKELRQYAYYSLYEPKPFLISEIESIRYSLKNTFRRLKKEQEELYKLSTHDPLTGLLNRHTLNEKISWLIDMGKRNKKGFALLFIDLDNFKNINDTKGHEVGDKILVEVAKRLKKAVRKNDIVARFGGDEFVIVLPETEQKEQIAHILRRIREHLAKPIDGYTISASIGVVLYPKDGLDPQTLLKHADLAMYQAKFSGKNRFHFYTTELNKKIEEELHIEALIIKALQQGNFKLFYQPKIDLISGKVIGCEALLRLIDPLEVTISPNKFIPVAEKSGLIKAIGRWVLHETIQQLQRWRSTQFANLSISINVSAIELRSKSFYGELEHSLQTIPPHLLDIEITESVFIEDKEFIVKRIERLKSLGVTLSLDDFGTGYSSLSYLKKIPFDTLKIDKSFIDDIENPQDRQFVHTIINISKTLGLHVVAEGIETETQLQLLKEMGCDICQGFLCSKPLPVEEFEKKVEEIQGNF